MGVLSRLNIFAKIKMSKMLDKHEDPRETLDYSYEKQLELLTGVRRGLAEVATSRKRLEIQMRQITGQSDKLQSQAQQCMEQDREDLARECVARRIAIQAQLDHLATQHATLVDDEEKLVLAQQRLQIKVEDFRTRKETIKAQYSAAEAQAKIGEAFAGISSEMGEIGMTMQRADDMVLTMQARAGGLDELLSSGALDSPLSSDHITNELAITAARTRVDEEIGRMREALPAAKRKAVGAE